MNKSVNLRDSLEIVTSDNLLRDLGEKVAPDLAYSSPRGLSPRIVMCLMQRRRDAEKRHKETVGRSVPTHRLRLLGQRASCHLE